MARNAREKLCGKVLAHYHLISRTNNRCFFFNNDRFKDEIVSLLKRTAKFSGIMLRAFANLDNHFHIVVTVDRTCPIVSEGEILERIGALRGADSARRVALRWQRLHEEGKDEELEVELNRYRRRMNDISEFIKTFKELINIHYKKTHDYCGTLWSGRFTSTLIEDGRYLVICMRYVLYNPIRARIVRRAIDYRWCWSEEFDAGTVPEWQAGIAPGGEGRFLRRQSQISAGRIFGSKGFVDEMILALSDCFSAKRVVARAVDEIGYTTHGWKLDQQAVA